MGERDTAELEACILEFLVLLSGIVKVSSLSNGKDDSIIYERVFMIKNRVFFNIFK